MTSIEGTVLQYQSGQIRKKQIIELSPEGLNKRHGENEIIETEHRKTSLDLIEVSKERQMWPCQGLVILFQQWKFKQYKISKYEAVDQFAKKVS